MEEYPYLKCEHPRYITNHAGKKMLVRCGRCRACMMSKASNYTSLCDLEALAHPFGIFGTLTYDNVYIPRMTPIYDKENHEYMLVDHTPRLKTEGVILGTSKITYRDLSMLRSKFNIGGDIPYLCKYDLQLFFKRLRKYVYSKFRAKIRFFACGEYGPKHYRPHYHFIFYTDSSEVARYSDEIIRSCWSFGGVNSSIASCGCTEYISQYVNSYCTVPSVLRLSETKPFNTHSQKLGEKILSIAYKGLYDRYDFRGISNRCYNINGKPRDINTTRFLQNRYFPRCREFSTSTNEARVATYSIYNTLRSYYKTDKLNEIAHYALNDIISYFPNFGSLPEYIRNDLYYLGNTTRNLHWSVDDGYLPTYNCICNILRTSRNFLENLPSQDYASRSERVALFEQFYSTIELTRLGDFYHLQEQTLITDDLNEQLFSSFYDNYNEHFDLQDKDTYLLKDNPLYKEYIKRIEHRFNNAVKHKALNDANQIFNYM